MSSMSTLSLSSTTYVFAGSLVVMKLSVLLLQKVGLLLLLSLDEALHLVHLRDGLGSHQRLLERLMESHLLLEHLLRGCESLLLL